MNNNKIAGVALASFSVLVWGVTFVATKALLTDFSALEILLYRFVAAYLALWVICPKVEKISLRENLIFALAGLSGVVVYQFAENTALHFTACCNVSIIVSLCPMLTAIIAQIFLREHHITRWFIIGFVVAISGVTMVSLDGYGTIEFNLRGDLLAFFAAVCWGFYSLCVTVINRRRYNAVCSTRRIFFFAVLFMIPLVVVGAHTEAGSPSHFSFDAAVNAARFTKAANVLNMLFLGVVASGLCFWAWNRACSILGTVSVSAGIYLIPVVTIVFAHFFLGENLSALGIAGAMLTIAGLFIGGKRRRTR